MSGKKNKANKQQSADAIAKANGSVSTSETKSNKGEDVVTVQFIHSFTPYVKGDIAGFSAERADELVDKGVAELI